MDKMDGMTMNIEQANVEKLKEVFPEVFADGKVDFDKLQGLLGHYIADDKEKYSFSWKGKADSLRLAQKRSTGTLRPCKEESKDWDTTENLYIEGDNLEVLKLLQSSYLNSVKMIYIDPPYNTGNDFVYTDDFADGIAHYKEVTGQATKSNPETAGRYHTNWLNMMYPRLKLARNLLTDDGVIFISIDDNEQANLKKICDEVFGEDNFVAVFPWRKRTAKSDVPFGVSQDYEWIIAYARSQDFIAAIKGGTRKYYETPDFPGRPWRVHDLTTQRNASERPNSNFTIINPKTGEEFPANPNATWRVTKDSIEEYNKANRIVFPGDYDFLKISKPVLRYWKEDDMTKAGDKFGYITVSTKLPDMVGMSQDGTKEVTALLNSKIFNYPKPVELIKYMCMFGSDKDSLILDFFSGSATTAHAVMQLNAEDGGHRKFICVQLPEKTDEQSEAYKAGYKTICEIGKERIRRAGEKIKDGLKRVDIYVSAIGEIAKDKYIKSQIESYVLEVKNKWIENEDNPQIEVNKVIETIKTIINSKDDTIADESTYEKGGEKLSDLVMRLAYEVTGLTFGVDIGFKVFKLDSSNLVKWDNTPTSDEEEVKKRIQQSLFYLVEGREDLDLVYEIMLKYGLSLTLPVEERKFDVVTAYIINHPDYKVLICLQPNITLSAVEEMDKETIGTYIFADRCFADANILSNTEEILKKKDKEMRLF